jgi:hypothetical protein
MVAGRGVRSRLRWCREKGLSRRPNKARNYDCEDGTHEAKEIDLVPVTLGPRLDRWSSDDKIILSRRPTRSW